MTGLVRLPRRTGLPGPAVLAGVVLAACAVAGCGASAPRRVHLLDGSVAPALPSVLVHLGQRAVVSSVRVVAASRLDTLGRACLASFRGEFTISPATRVVSRLGVAGASLTLRDATGTVVLGCDRTARASASAPSHAWCARSVGRLEAGRLLDPRVDVLCRDADGRPVGFGWLQPHAAEARWIAVHDGARVDVEPVLGPLPVRALTHAVNRETSSAAFAVTEHAADGTELARYAVRAGVAG